MTPIFTEFPMRCFRLQTEEEIIYDIFIPDIYEPSSIVMITDFNGDMVPFSKWEGIEKLLTDYLTKNIY